MDDLEHKARVAAAIVRLPKLEQMTLSLMFEQQLSIFDASRILDRPPEVLLTAYTSAIININAEFTNYNIDRRQIRCPRKNECPTVK